MLEDILKKVEPELSENAPVANGNSLRWTIGMSGCTLGFILCLLLTVTTLIRMPDTRLTLHISPGTQLAIFSQWLPVNLGTSYQRSSASIEFFSLMTLATLCYGLALLLVRRRSELYRQTPMRICIWLGVMLGGAIYIVTPATLSHDITVYAGYGRLIAIHHANPYFALMSSFRHDPMTAVDDWASIISAYGPIWMLVCAFWGWLLSPDPNVYVICFRLFALSMHLLNIWLVGRTLKSLDRSPRAVTLGMLLYAWNPLVLLESSLGGHNDVFMMTFVLTGVLCAAQAEKRGILLRARGYMPVIIALTLAVLVKFTALPILGIFLLFLAYKALPPWSESVPTFKRALRHWFQIVPVLVPALLTALMLALAIYGPFWSGHSLQKIIASFQSPPSATRAENSLMRSVVNWLYFHKDLQHNVLLSALSSRRFWDGSTMLAIVLCLCLGTRRLWRHPTTSSFILLALSVMCVVLLLTPWFFPWYITWLIALAAVCITNHPGRREMAWLALALTFSFSALVLYLFNEDLLGSRGYLNILFTIIPPVCAFLCILLLYPAKAKLIKAEIEH